MALFQKRKVLAMKTVNRDIDGKFLVVNFGKKLF